jgi:hypothetical protein
MSIHINGWKSVTIVIAGLGTCIAGALLANPALMVIGSGVASGALGAAQPWRGFQPRTRNEDTRGEIPARRKNTRAGETD